MAHSLTQIYLHVVFSTKGRTPFLQDKPLRLRLHTYLAGTCQNLESIPLAVGGVEDHVHVLCALGKSISVADFVRELKRESSKWLKEQAESLMSFYWQNGYGAFSVSPAHVAVLIKYIRNQERHHQTVTYQDEYRSILAKYGLEYDEQYLWD